MACTGHVGQEATTFLSLAGFEAETFSHVVITGSATEMTMTVRDGQLKPSVSGSQRGFTVRFVSAGS